MLPLLLFMFCVSSVYAYDKEYVEGEVIVLIDDSYTYSAKGFYGSNIYSEAIDYMAESFADSVGLVSMGTFPEISRVSGNHIVHLKSETKNTDQLMEELLDNPYVKSVQPNYIRHLFDASAAQLNRTNSNKSCTKFKSNVSEAAFTTRSAGVDKPTSSKGSKNNEAYVLNATWYQNVLPPNDTYYDELWGMRNIGMPQVWEHTTGSRNVCVAVIDSGIDYNHPDLNANIAKDSRGNYGRAFKNGVQSSNTIDTQGHGTHVAGIIGAVGNNGIGVAGVNWNVQMLAVNVMTNSIALDSDVVTAINYILSEKKSGMNIRVVNMSFGGWDTPIPEDSPFRMAVGSLSDAGILCILAAGNESQNISDPTGNFVGKLVHPACFRFANTITVGSIGEENTISGFSNYGREWVDIAAPGESIYSTLPNNKYGTMKGTSMSAAHVAGAAAILFAAFPSETANQIKGRILKGGRNSSSNQAYFGNGLLDVAGAYGIESENIKDEPITSVKITGERNISLGGSTFLRHTKNPAGANGSFEYSWESSNKSIVKLSGNSNPSAEVTGLSKGSATITFSVTQTLQNGTKITKKDSIVISVANTSSSDSSSSSGCNFGLFFVSLLLALPILKMRV
jgi:subtilisin family serine protease